MEDSPHFNAGHGAALNADGRARARRLDHGRRHAGRRGGLRGAPHPQPGQRRPRRDGARLDACCWPATAADDFAAACRARRWSPTRYFTTERRVAALRQPEGARRATGTHPHGERGREARHRRRRRARLQRQSRRRHLDRRLQQQARRPGRRQSRSSAPAPTPATACAPSPAPARARSSSAAAPPTTWRRA